MLCKLSGKSQLILYRLRVGLVLLHITFWICCATALFSAGVVIG